MGKLKVGEKLKLALKSPRLALLLKAFIFGLFLYWAYSAPSGVFFETAFLVAAVVLYFRPFFNAGAFLSSFSVIVILSLIVEAQLSLSPFLKLISAGIFSVLFYILLGLKELIIVHRLWMHRFLYATLFYISALFYFYSDNSVYILPKVLALGLAAFLLFGEFLSRNAVMPARRALTMSALLAMLVFEGAWVLGLLPSGFISAANLIFISVLFFEEMVSCFYIEKLNSAALIKRLVVLIFLFLAVLFTSKWRL